MATNLNLKMQLMDVVTAYLYESLDSEIHMRVPKGLKIPGLNLSVWNMVPTLTSSKHRGLSLNG
jgi:hypothetical protein